MASRYRVLIVEDDEIFSMMLAYNLEHAGYEVVTAASASPAIDILESDATIDVLFTDIQMPGTVDGQGLAQRARTLRPEIAVIYASAGYKRLDEIDAVPGASFMAKPFLPSAARAEVERKIARQTALVSNRAA